MAVVFKLFQEVFEKMYRRLFLTVFLLLSLSVRIQASQEQPGFCEAYYNFKVSPRSQTWRQLSNLFPGQIKRHWINPLIERQLQKICLRTFEGTLELQVAALLPFEDPEKQEEVSPSGPTRLSLFDWGPELGSKVFLDVAQIHAQWNVPAANFSSARNFSMKTSQGSLLEARTEIHSKKDWIEDVKEACYYKCGPYDLNECTSPQVVRKQFFTHQETLILTLEKEDQIQVRFVSYPYTITDEVRVLKVVEPCKKN